MLNDAHGPLVGRRCPNTTPEQLMIDQVIDELSQDPSRPIRSHSPTCPLHSSDGHRSDSWFLAKHHDSDRRVTVHQLAASRVSSRDQFTAVDHSISADKSPPLGHTARTPVTRFSVSDPDTKMSTTTKTPLRCYLLIAGLLISTTLFIKAAPKRTPFDSPNAVDSASKHAPPLPKGRLGGDEPASAPTTPIPTHSLKPIESLSPGDLVLSRDPTTGEISSKPISQTFHRVSDHLRILKIRASDATTIQELKTTNEHPFWVHPQGWTKARDLKPGDQVLQTDGALSTILATTHEPHPEGIEVYNFEVTDHHSYFVTAHGARAPPVWVHNKSIAKVLKNAIKRVTRRKGRASGAPSLSSSGVAANTSNASKVQQRAQALLEGAPGVNVTSRADAVKYRYNVSGGREGAGTALTDLRAFEDVIGPLPSNNRMNISSGQASDLERALGLPTGRLNQGGIISVIEDVGVRGPRSSVQGNDLFLGGGRGLPGGGPEVNVAPINNAGGAGIRQIVLEVSK